MKPTVLITAPIPKPGLEALQTRCQVLYPPAQAAFTPSEMLGFAPQVDAVLACGAIDAAFVAAAKKLRVVSNYGVGYDRVDVAALTRAGIPLTNLPEETTGPTAELTMALLLSLSRRITELDHKLRTQAPEGVFGLGRHMGHSLEGRTLGIVGMGRIGRAVRDMATAFGMRVVYHNRTPLSPDLAGQTAYLPLDDLLAASDAVTLHCPLTPATQGLLSAARIAHMKRGAMLINTARGAVVDTTALLEALTSGHLSGAGLDVYPDEPHIPAPLLTLEQVVLTPHIGTNTYEARKAMAARAAQNILDVLDGGRPARVVNPEVYTGK